MGLTGLNNFSIPIQNALTNDGYKGGELTDISVTGLIDSARIKKLRNTGNENTEDFILNVQFTKPGNLKKNERFDRSYTKLT